MTRKYRGFFDFEADYAIDAAIKLYSIFKRKSFSFIEITLGYRYEVKIEGNRLEIRCDKNGYFESRPISIKENEDNGTKDNGNTKEGGTSQGSGSCQEKG